MTGAKTIVCLASSRKPGGVCVAGKVKDRDGYGPWIRPVRVGDCSALPADDWHYPNGRNPRPLDIVTVPLVGARPDMPQTENYEIDPDVRWVKHGELCWTELNRLVDNTRTLWKNGDSSTYGENDRIDEDSAAGFDYSLLLIKPACVTLCVGPKGEEFGDCRRQVRAFFTNRADLYNLVITDRYVERQFLAKPDNEYCLTDAFLCVSLGEPFNGWRYKLVASVMTRPVI